MENVRLLTVMALAIVFSAVVSNGYYQPDEHFMIFEFVGLKLGITPAAGLTWEYVHRIRPWMQPALYYGLSQPFLLAGLEDPFLLALLFRLASGAVFFVGICLLIRGLPRLIDTEEGQRAAAKVLTLSWFIPVLAVRTSSESLSAAMICITLGCVLAAFDHPSDWRGRAWFAAAGLAQGFAFQFRFQVAFIILGLFAWLFWIKRVRWADFLLMASVSLASLGLGLLVDAWGYGRFTVASYHYLHQNFLLGHAAKFGVSPVYGYFLLAATNYMAPFTLVMALALLVMWIRRPLHPVTWITVPFVLAHTLIGHKEWRFMFPIAVFASLALVLAVTPVGDRNPGFLARLWNMRHTRWFKAVLVVNLAAGVLSPIVLIRMPLVAQRYLYYHLPPRATLLVVGVTPYSKGGTLPMHFYRRRDIRHVPVADEDLAAKIAEEGRPIFVVFDNPEKAGQAMQRYDGKLIFELLPSWAPRFNFFNWTSRTRIWKVIHLP